MRKVLTNEIKNERCNAAALGLFNASVVNGDLDGKMSFEDFIQDQEEGDKSKKIKSLEIDIEYLEKDLQKMYNTSVTPFGDKLSKHFPKGNVGYMNGKGAKIKEREFVKNIDHSIKIKAKEQELSSLKSHLKKEKAGNIIRKNGLSVMPYRTLRELTDKIPSVIKSKSHNGKSLSDQDVSNLKKSLSNYKKQLIAREKMYRSMYENYSK
ncbi:MAG: hypothetical protein ACRC0E_09195 [Soonwooa sp.]